MLDEDLVDLGLVLDVCDSVEREKTDASGVEGVTWVRK